MVAGRRSGEGASSLSCACVTSLYTWLSAFMRLRVRVLSACVYVCKRVCGKQSGRVDGGLGCRVDRFFRFFFSFFFGGPVGRRGCAERERDTNTDADGKKWGAKTSVSSSSSFFSRHVRVVVPDLLVHQLAHRLLRQLRLLKVEFKGRGGHRLGRGVVQRR